ncbi:hypothetical protein JCM10550A_12580 [Methanogenium cariaci]
MTPTENISIETTLLEHNMNSLSDLGRAGIQRFDYPIQIVAINNGHVIEDVHFKVTMLNSKGTKELQCKEFEINDFKPNEIFESEIHFYDTWSVQDPIIKVSNIYVIREK